MGKVNPDTKNDIVLALEKGAPSTPDGGGIAIFVGYASRIYRGWRAFFRDPEHGMRKLSDLLAAGTNPDYTSLARAKGINNAGQIIVSVHDYDEGLVLTPFVLGDLNCDEQVDEQDIGPLLLLLLHPEEDAQTYPECPGEWAGDVNRDGMLDFDDLHTLHRFVDRPPPAVPKPRARPRQTGDHSAAPAPTGC